MLRFRLGTIPVAVRPWFLVTALLIGPRDLPGLALWVPVVFVGVLIHELGHALAVRRRGLLPTIELHAFGGLTRWSGASLLSPRERALVSAAGPAVGITVGTAALALAKLTPPAGPLLGELVQYAVWVNLGWGVLNLLPVLPLDGGMIVGSLVEGAWGERGLYAYRVLSVVACVGLCVVAVSAGWLWSAFLAGVLAISNLQATRSA
jgi:membrane-associated protease RseP (regulator of RpoE activity)